MANTQKNKQQKLIERRKHRVRSRIQGTTERPRLSVHRSLRYISAQIIDDQTGSTIAASTDRGLKDSEVNAEKGRSKNTARAFAVGMDIAKQAQAKGITVIVFDRGPYKYHGRVQALAEGAREGGLKF